MHTQVLLLIVATVAVAEDMPEKIDTHLCMCHIFTARTTDL